MIAPIFFTQVFAPAVAGAQLGAPFLLGGALLVASLALTTRDRIPGTVRAGASPRPRDRS